MEFEIQLVSGLDHNLHDRKQQVEINIPDSNNSIYSDWGIIMYTVLQGSELGPFLFLIYILMIFT
jgi:hypothetical protein